MKSSFFYSCQKSLPFGVFDERPAGVTFFAQPNTKGRTVFSGAAPCKKREECVLVY